MGFFECFGYSLKRYDNNEMIFANQIKQKHFNKTKTISVHAYNDDNVRYWTIPVNNIEFYMFFDKDFNQVGWDFVSNTGEINTFKVKSLLKELNKVNDISHYGFIQIESNICPLNLIVVNYDAVSESDIDKDVNVETTIFTENIEIFKNEKVFYKKQKEDTKFSSESIIPTGMFPGRNPASIWLNAKVVSVERCCNDITYYAIIVECCGLKFNVFTTEKIGKKISVGNILSVKDDVFAKVIKKPTIEYKEQ